VTGSDFEYIVTVRDGTKVSSTGRSAEGTRRVEEIDICEDPLRDLTIKVLQEWLDRCGTLAELDPDKATKSLQVLDTFKVIGTYLYRLAFPGQIGTNFDIVCGEAAKVGHRLRLSLRFIGLHRERIEAYPWEFLYSSAEKFIGSDENIILSRDLDDERAKVTPHEPPLRITFLVSIPDSTEFTDERKELLDNSYKFNLAHRRVEKYTIESWDKSKMLEGLSVQQPHVLHVFGVCRSSRVGIEIALAVTEDGKVEWHGAGTFVEVLAGAFTGISKPELVVLHLCQAKSVDYAATFGSVARELVEQGFRAVLAMQYPLPLKGEAAGFPEMFYDLLAGGTQLGVAVQLARNNLAAIGNHLRGAPVLYLQSEDGVVIGELPSSVTAAGADVGAIKSGRGGQRQTAVQVLRGAIAKLENGDVADELRHFVDGQESRSTSEVALAIGKRVKGEDSPSRKNALYFLLTALEKADLE
jgi:hypothetical protein